jgi:hypothetical protein
LSNDRSRLLCPRFFDYTPDEVFEDKIMRGDKTVPIDGPPEAFGHEIGGNYQIGPLNGKFEPGPTRQFHLGLQQKPSVFLQVYYLPKIKLIAYP